MSSLQFDKGWKCGLCVNDNKPDAIKCGLCGQDRDNCVSHKITILFRVVMFVIETYAIEEQYQSSRRGQGHRECHYNCC